LHRDIMREVADACRREGITPCWYHSIMDWHHPDYLPRRPWEQAMRPTRDADFERYNRYLDNQVTELLTNYGPIGVMWFDGQWEGTWNHARGQALYDLCRKLQPNVIVNNRCDRGGGPFQMTRDADVKYAGDYGTPEQEIPPTGMPGDWETCMTMNDHWGYNKNDHHYKSTADLIHKLADIASKGGNFLLNVGPTADGEIPPEAMERLHEIGEWMAVNGESIHGTQASPFEKPFAWGRCTQKAVNSGIVGPNRGGGPVTRLYLHVFDWPTNGKLIVPAIFNEPRGARLLGASQPLHVSQAGPENNCLIVDVPQSAPDPIDTVIALDVLGSPDVSITPKIVSSTGSDIFVSSGDLRGPAGFTIDTPQRNIEIRYTLNGSDPTLGSRLIPGWCLEEWAAENAGTTLGPTCRDDIQLGDTCTVSARAFRKGRPVSPIARRTFTKVIPLPAIATTASARGVRYEYFEGDWNQLPDFTHMRPAATGIAHDFSRSQHPESRIDRFGFRYHGYYEAPHDGVYTFYLASDDGSNLYVDGQKVVNNDGLHSLEEKSGSVALAAGAHAITIDFFEKSGGHELTLAVSEPGRLRRPIKADELKTEPTSH
jgi:alpha-L-fucosidase